MIIIHKNLIHKRPSCLDSKSFLVFSFLFSDLRAVVTAPFGRAPGGWLLDDEAGELTGVLEGGLVDMKSPFERICSIASLIALSGSSAGALVGGASAAAPVANNRRSSSSPLGSNGDGVPSDGYGVAKMDSTITKIDSNTLINRLSSTCITQNITLIFTCYYTSVTCIKKRF